MATVYRAVQTALRRQVALKVLHDGVARDADYRERFLREARAAARLSHGNVVRAYEAGVHEGTYWFAMELVEGEDLGERLGWCHSLGEAEALGVAVQVARGLVAAEEHGLVHRDVKPENILLAHDGGVKLADLGLAKAQGDASITAAGMTVGTVAFLSPEQCRGAADLDVRSDLWALGAVLYTMLAGDLPYGRGDNAVVTMKRILREDPPPLEGRARVSAPTAALVRRLMARRREERPADAAEALSLLEEAARRVARGEEPTAPAGARRPRRTRRRPGLRARGPSLLSFVGPALVAAAVGVAAFLALSHAAAAAPAAGPARAEARR
jgi:serine/threonine-protein kinase